jgi:glycosyltransferase involved in cell wall biosynthesis
VIKTTKSDQNSKPALSYYTNMPTPYQLDFCEALTEHFQLKVVFFTSRESDRQWDLKISDKYEYRILKSSWLSRLVQKKIVSFHFSWQILQLLRKDNAQFVVVNGTYWSPNVVLVLFLGHLRNKKVWYYGEPLFAARGKLQNIFKRKILAYPLKKWATGIFAIGKWAVNSYLDLGFKSPVYNIPYNINTSLFKLENIDSRLFNKLRGDFDLEGHVILLSSGSLIARKGMDVLISAFNLLPRDLNAKLLIMGEGPDKNFLVELAKDNDKVIFLGFQEKQVIPAFFNLSDIFVFASKYDGWGLVINEAVAAGNAIICSDAVGAAADKLINEVNAIILDPGDIEGFAAAMLDLIEHEEKRKLFIQQSISLEPDLSSALNARKVYDICRRVK